MTLKPDPTPGDTSWFVHDRFGMFIHWGVYANAARHEWVRNREHITVEDYEKYYQTFDPDLYDPNAWADAAAEAGMKYFVITTKHHDGFCLWDTRQTDYKAPNTPAGRDLIAPMVEAFRGRGLRVGFYYSIIDWHHPHYTIDRTHPQARDEEFVKANQDRDIAKYREYLYAQVSELLTDYGKVDYLFFDFTVQSIENDPLPGKSREDWQSEELVKMIRGLQPDIVINDRLDYPQDVRTPEQFCVREWPRVDGKPIVWETCQTFSGSWGYHRDEESWKSDKQLVCMLVDTVSKGGNLLLNVGPTGRGEFDSRALDRLSAMGEWMDRHGRAVYGCTQAPEEFETPADCRYTYNPETNRLYCHVFNWPFRFLVLPGMAGRVEYAQLLNDASETPFRSKGPLHAPYTDGVTENDLLLTIPVKQPDTVVPVIELILK